MTILVLKPMILIDFGDHPNYPLVICYGLLLKIAIEIMDFPINSMVIFHSCLQTFTRG